jgi:Protein of unknown function (DUF1214)
MTSEQAPHSRKALRGLIELLEEIDERYLGEEWGAADFGDIADGFRYVANMIEAGFLLGFDADPERPFFRPIVSRARKLLGDNTDALYYTAPIRDDLVYIVKGNVIDTVYLSFTVEAGSQDAGYSDDVAGVINQNSFDVDDNGDLEIIFGGPQRGRNWFPLAKNAAELVVRAYFEDASPRAADVNTVVPLTIDQLESVEPPEPWNDASVAAGFDRAVNFVRTRTLDFPKPGAAEQPGWISPIPNTFRAPETPQGIGYAATDAKYSMAPYVLAPDEALVITGRWPEAAFGNVCLWTRYMQTYDYAHRPVSRNRANTTVESDGSFRMIIAHQDPGLPNWLDTEGRSFGIVFWRFFLPTGEVETPNAAVVKVADLHG